MEVSVSYSLRLGYFLITLPREADSVNVAEEPGEEACEGLAFGTEQSREEPSAKALTNCSYSREVCNRLGVDQPVVSTLKRAKHLEIGRRNWTRTNDPHHVKVVL